jgi:mRNA interferase RelE/StbE
MRYSKESKRMKYLFTDSARKDISKLDSAAAEQIKTTLKKYLSDPLKYAKKLTHFSIGTYRFRIGDYRVIFDIEGQDIIILRVGHRQSIYKK